MMSFISFKKSFIGSGLLHNMTDIHSHILWGVDDGVKTYTEAVTSLRWLKGNGISRTYLTPHIMSDFSKNTSEYLSEAFSIFVKRLEDDGIGDIPELRLGAEYMLELAFEKHKKEGLLTYANNNVLVETSYMTPPMGFVSILEKLMEDGYSPVLAHPERYIYMDMKDYEYFIAEGIKFQLNLLSMTGAYGKHAKEKATKLLNEGHYKYVGSDFHRLSRHESDYMAKSLTKKQVATLSGLFENNYELW